MAETADSQMLICDRLCKAIDNNDIENVKMCIENRVDLNKTCYSERYHKHLYPLALACLYGHEEVIEELIKAGADPNQVSGSWPWRPAMFIVQADKRVLTLSTLRCLISHGADVDFRDDSSETILHYLTRGQISGTRDELLSAAKLVLDNGVSFYDRDDDDRTPLYEACRSGNIDFVNLFIAEGAGVNCDIRGQTMLRMAADRCDIDMFDLLIHAGANRHLNPGALVNPCDRNDHAMIARILDTCDVNINLEVLGYYPVFTILIRACWSRDITSETVRLLLDRGADVRAVSGTGDTALHYAAMHCECNKIRQLLSYNHPLNIKNNVNQTPLLKLTQALIKHYSLSRQQADTGQCNYATNMYQAGLLAFKMLVTAGAKVTADVEHKLNQFHIKNPEAQLPDYEIRSTRSLKEMCRFVIRGSIHVPVDVSLRKLPIPKLSQEYLNFPECDQSVDNYLNVFTASVATTTTTSTTTTTTTTTTCTTTISTTAASTSTTSTSTSCITAASDDDIDNIDD